MPLLLQIVLAVVVGNVITVGLCLFAILFFVPVAADGSKVTS